MGGRWLVVSRQGAPSLKKIDVEGHLTEKTSVLIRGTDIGKIVDIIMGIIMD
jgi:hypothetical protein